MKILEKKMYEKAIEGISLMSSDMVEIIGEQKMEDEGKIYDQYLYNIVGYTPENGYPFVALKSNIVRIEQIEAGELL